MNSKQPHFAMHPTLPEHKYPSLHSSSEAIRRACLPTPPVSAPRPRFQPAHPPLPVSETLHVGCWCVQKSRSGDLRAGIFRGIPLLGTFCTVGLNVVFLSPLPPCPEPAMSGERWGHDSRLSPTFSVNFMPQKGDLCVCGCATRVPSCELHLHFFFPSSFFVSHARSRNVFLCPSPYICLPTHTPDPSRLSPCLISNVSPIPPFPVSTTPTPVVVILVTLCLSFACAFWLVCGFVLCCVLLFWFCGFFGLVCVACSCRATSSPA